MSPTIPRPTLAFSLVDALQCFIQPTSKTQTRHTHLSFSHSRAPKSTENISKSHLPWIQPAEHHLDAETHPAESTKTSPGLTYIPQPLPTVTWRRFSANKRIDRTSTDKEQGDSGVREKPAAACILHKPVGWAPGSRGARCTVIPHRRPFNRGGGFIFNFPLKQQKNEAEMKEGGRRKDTHTPTQTAFPGCPHHRGWHHRVGVTP